MKETKREPTGKVRILSLEIFINTEDGKQEFESNFTFRCDKRDAINIIEEFIEIQKKGDKTDGRA